MKASHVFCGLVLAVACAGAAYRANAQQPAGAAPVEAANKQHRDAEERVKLLLRGRLATDSDARPEERQGLRDKLRPLVEESFAARQQLQQAEIEALRRRLAEIEQAIGARERNKDVIIQARIEELLSGAPAGSKSYTVRRYFDEVRMDQPRTGSADTAGGGDSGADDAPAPPRQTVELAEGTKYAAPRSPTFETARGEVADDDGKRSAADDVFDLETHEQLLRIDLEAAEAKFQSAKIDFNEANARHQMGTITAEALRSRERERNLAETELRRVQVKLDGLARRRTQLETAADAALDEAAAEREKAAERILTSKARYESAKAAVQKAEAGLQAAQSHYSHLQKQFERIKKLANDKAVDEKLVDETVEKLAAAKAAVAAAESSVRGSEAELHQQKSVVEVARQSFDRAEKRVRAAQNRRDQLKHRTPSDEADGERQPAAEPRAP